MFIYIFNFATFYSSAYAKPVKWGGQVYVC